MPILETLYPHHWLFEDHPLHNNDCDWDQKDEKWEMWVRLVNTIFHAAVKHEDQYLQDRLSVELPEMPVPHDMLALAKRIGATWLSDRKLSAADIDPAAEVARTIIRRQLECTVCPLSQRRSRSSFSGM